MGRSSFPPHALASLPLRAGARRKLKAGKVPFQNGVDPDENCNVPAQTTGIRLSGGHQHPLAVPSHRLFQDARSPDYDFIRERGIPIATINRGLFPAACGSKNLVVSSS